MHIEHFLVGLIAGLIAMYMIIMVCNSCNINIAGLDNRPRWMMGGLRDDTGSHNARDVFGMGFGLDQTRVGTATTDAVFSVNKGIAQHNIGGVTASEYGAQLGDPQLAAFINKKKNGVNLPNRPSLIRRNSPRSIVKQNQKFLDKREPARFLDKVSKVHFASKPQPGTTEDYLATQLSN